MRGNHHDAWVNGADDPISGAIALMEEARSFATLLQQGWKPKRTIIYCVWDGEEPGLLGSTEWGEAHADELRKHAVAYINTDGNGRGYFSAGGSHLLEKFINGVAKDVEDPEKKISVWKRSQLESHRGSQDPRGADRSPATAGPAHSCHRVWVRLDRLHRPSRYRVPQPRLTAAKRAAPTAAASTTPSMTISTGTRTSPIPTSAMARRCPRPWVPR